MNIFLKVLIFFLINAIGYYVGPTLYALLVLKMGVIDYSNPTIDLAQFEQTYFIRTLLSWGVCAVFSFVSFFLKSSLRFAFLLAPIFIPVVISLFYILSAA